METEKINNGLRVKNLGTTLSILGPIALGLVSLYSLAGDNTFFTTEDYFGRILPWTIGPNLILLVAAYAFWTDKSWARHVVMGFLLLSGVLLVSTAFSGQAGFLLSSLVMILLFMTGVTFWYLYEEGYVASYYSNLGGADWSAISNSRAIAVLLVVPFINLLVLMKLTANLFTYLSARLENLKNTPDANPVLVLALMGLFFLGIGVIVTYLVGFTFSYLALLISFNPEMTAADKIWHLFIWPLYNHLIIPGE